MRARRLRALLAATVLLGATTSLVTGAPATAQDAGGTFSGTAAADAVRVNVAIPNYLLIEDFVDGGGPSAQAVLDSLGVSRAFSSFPYPGELGVAATGLISTLTGFSLPSYPLIANSDYPTQPERNIDQPGFHLNAKSDPASAVGGARFGETTQGESLEGGGFTTASVTTDDDGAVVARGETRFSIVLGPVAFRGVRAVAQATRDAAGDIDLLSELEVTTIAVGGVEIGLTDRGLVLAGAPLIPIDAITGLTGVLTFGTTQVRFLPAATTEDSVVSAGLEVTTAVDLPGVGRPVNVTYRLGNVFAMASSSAFGADAVPSLPLPEDTAGPVDLGAAPSFDVPAVVSGPVGSDAPELAGTPTATRHRVGDAVRVSAWTFFPILLLAGLALVAGTFGERWQHTRDSRGGS